MNREEAIEWFDRQIKSMFSTQTYIESDKYRAYRMAIEALNEVQKHEETFEWCHDCKEYDTKNHCCHRWSKVIRNTVEELKEEPPTIPCFTESAEAYKAWTGEEMGGSRLIDKHLLMEELQKETEKETSPTIRAGLIKAQRITQNAPTVLVDRPQGEWIIHADDLFPEESTQEYSVCHEKQFVHIGNDDNYRPNCGADMRGGDGE